MRKLKDWLFAQFARLTLPDAVPDWLHRHTRSESTDKGNAINLSKILIIIT